MIIYTIFIWIEKIFRIIIPSNRRSLEFSYLNALKIWESSYPAPYYTYPNGRYLSTMNTLRIRFEIFLVVVLLLIGCVPAVNAENASSGTAVLTNLIQNSTVYPAEPFITIDPIVNHFAGDFLIIHGTTNLPVSTEKNLLFSISSTGVTPGGSRGSFYYATNLAIISGVNDYNQWSKNITDIGIPVPGEYFIHISSTDTNTSAYQLFNVVPPHSPPLPEKPFITIDPIGNRTIGGVFVIHGTTNLPASTNKSLLLSITPTWKDPDRYSGYIYSKYLTVIQGENKTNHWSENVTEVDWRSNNEYFVKISSLFVQNSLRINTPVATQIFTIFPANTSLTLIHSSPSPNQSPSIQNPSLILPTTDKVTLTPSTRVAQLLALLPIAIMVRLSVTLNFINGKKRD